MSERREELIPALGVVTDIRTGYTGCKDIPCCNARRHRKHLNICRASVPCFPIPGVGEGMFSITSSPTQEEYMEFSIKKCGCLTRLAVMQLSQDSMITVRGPYGNGFPVDTELKGKESCCLSPVVSDWLRFIL